MRTRPLTDLRIFGGLALHVDGKAVKTIAFSEVPALSGNPFHIGALAAEKSGFYRAFRGAVDDVALYSGSNVGGVAPAFLSAPPSPPSLPKLPGPSMACGRLDVGQGLNSGGVLKSCNQTFRLVLQAGDGNLVLYRGDKPLWATGTHGHLSYEFVVRESDIALFNDCSKVIWTSGTEGYTNAQLALRDDGNLVLSSNDTAIWSSKTGGH